MRPLRIGGQALSQQPFALRPPGRGNQHGERHIGVGVLGVELQGAPRVACRLFQQLRLLAAQQVGAEIAGGVVGLVLRQVGVGGGEVRRLGDHLPQRGQQLEHRLRIAVFAALLEQLTGMQVQREGRRIGQPAGGP